MAIMKEMLCGTIAIGVVFVGSALASGETAIRLAAIQSNQDQTWRIETGQVGAIVAQSEIITPVGDKGAFAEELRLAYLALARRAIENDDFDASNFFVGRAEILASGQLPLPLAAPEDNPDARSAADKLGHSFNVGARLQAPGTAANAQATYDCWISSLQIDSSKETAARCKTMARPNIDALAKQFAARPRSESDTGEQAPPMVDAEVAAQARKLMGSLRERLAGSVPSSTPDQGTVVINDEQGQNDERGQEEAPPAAAPIIAEAPIGVSSEERAAETRRRADEAAAAERRNNEEQRARAEAKKRRDERQARIVGGRKERTSAQAGASLSGPASAPAGSPRITPVGLRSRPAGSAPMAPGPMRIAKPFASHAPQGGAQMTGDALIVYFAFDSDQLTHEAQAYLRKTAQAAAAAGQVMQITLTGHTDRAGPDDYNDNLSIRRAEAVFSFLENKLGSTVEYQLFARGETMPAVPTADGMREARNRRVEIALR